MAFETIEAKWTIYALDSLFNKIKILKAFCIACSWILYKCNRIINANITVWLWHDFVVTRLWLMGA